MSRLMYAAVGDMTCNPYFLEWACKFTAFSPPVVGDESNFYGTQFPLKPSLFTTFKGDLPDAAQRRYGNVLVPMSDEYDFANQPWVWGVLDWVITQPPVPEPTLISPHEVGLAFVLGLKSELQPGTIGHASYSYVDSRPQPMYSSSAIQQVSRSVIKIYPPSTAGAADPWSSLAFQLFLTYPGPVLCLTDSAQCLNIGTKVGICTVSIKLYRSQGPTPSGYLAPTRPRMSEAFEGQTWAVNAADQVWMAAANPLEDWKLIKGDDCVGLTCESKTTAKKRARVESDNARAPSLAGLWRDGLVLNTVLSNSVEYGSMIDGKTSGCHVIKSASKSDIPGSFVRIKFRVSLIPSAMSTPFVLLFRSGLMKYSDPTKYLVKGFDQIPSLVVSALGTPTWEIEHKFDVLTVEDYDSFVVWIEATEPVPEGSVNIGWSAELWTTNPQLPMPIPDLIRNTGRADFVLSGQTKNPGPKPGNQKPSAAEHYFSTSYLWGKLTEGPNYERLSETLNTRLLGESLRDLYAQCSSRYRECITPHMLADCLIRTVRIPQAHKDDDDDLAIIDFSGPVGNEFPSSTGSKVTKFVPKPPVTGKFKAAKKEEEKVKAETCLKNSEIEESALNPKAWTKLPANKRSSESRGIRRNGSLKQLGEVCSRLREKFKEGETFSKWLYANRPDFSFVKTLLASDAVFRSSKALLATVYCSGIPDQLAPVLAHCLGSFFSCGDNGSDQEFTLSVLKRAIVCDGASLTWVMSHLDKAWPVVSWFFDSNRLASEWTIHVLDVCVVLFQTLMFGPDLKQEGYSVLEGQVLALDEKTNPTKGDVFYLNQRKLSVTGKTLEETVLSLGYQDVRPFYFLMAGKIVLPSYEPREGDYIRQLVRGLGGSDAPAMDLPKEPESKIKAASTLPAEVPKGEVKLPFDTRKTPIAIVKEVISHASFDKSVWGGLPAVSAMNLSRLYSETAVAAPTTLNTNSYSRDSMWSSLSLVNGTVASEMYLPPESLASYRRIDGVENSENANRLTPYVCDGSFAGPGDTVSWTTDADSVMATANNTSGLRAATVMGLGYRSTDLAAILSSFYQRSALKLETATMFPGLRPVAQLIRLALYYLTFNHRDRLLSKINYWHDANMPGANTVSMAQTVEVEESKGVLAFGEQLDLNRWPVTDGPPDPEDEGGLLRFWQDVGPVPAGTNQVLVLPHQLVTILIGDPEQGSLLLAIYLAAFTNYPTGLWFTTRPCDGAAGRTAVFCPHSAYTVVGGGEKRIDILLPVMTAGPAPQTDAGAQLNLRFVPRQVDGNNILVSSPAMVRPYNLCGFINSWMQQATPRDIAMVGELFASAHCGNQNMFNCAVEWASGFCGRYRVLVAPIPTLGAVPWTPGVSGVNVGFDGQVPAQAPDWGDFDVTSRGKSFVFPQMSIAAATAMNAGLLKPPGADSTNCATEWRNSDRAATYLRVGTRSLSAVYQAWSVMWGIPSAVWPILPDAASSYYQLVQRCYPVKAGYPPVSGVFRALSAAVFGGCTLDKYGYSLFEYATNPSGKAFTYVVNNNVVISDVSPSWLVKPFDWHSGIFPFLKQLAPSVLFPTTASSALTTGFASPDTVSNIAGNLVVKLTYGNTKEVESSYERSSMVPVSLARRTMARLVLSIVPINVLQWNITASGSSNLHGLMANQAAVANYRVGCQDYPVGDASQPADAEAGFAEDCSPIFVRASAVSPYQTALLTVKVAQMVDASVNSVSAIVVGRAPYTSDLVLLSGQNPGAPLNVSANQADAASFLSSVGVDQL